MNSAGVKTYLFHWLRALRAASPSRLTLATYPVAYSEERLIHQTSVFSPAETASALLRLGRPGLWFRRLTGGWSSTADVFHASILSFVAPSGPKITTTLHDVTYRLMPELHTAATLECHRQFDRDMLARTAGILCVSESTRQDAIRALSLAPEKLWTIHPGIDPRFRSVSPEAIETARRTLGIRQPYILFLSTIEPRKNLDRLLDAYLALPRDVRQQFDLLVAGGLGWKSESTAARLRLYGTNIRHLGYVDEALLPGLTAGATVFAYPSLYEGFGFPLAQAMAAGTPCLTSNNSSMAEIGGGGASELVDPQSVAEIASALNRLLTSESLRARLASRGRERASGFTWEACARKSVEFFEGLP